MGTLAHPQQRCLPGVPVLRGGLQFPRVWTVLLLSARAGAVTLKACPGANTLPEGASEGPEGTDGRLRRPPQTAASDGRLKTGWPGQAAGAWPSSPLPTVPQLAVPGSCLLCRCGETEGLLGAHLKST